MFLNIYLSFWFLVLLQLCHGVDLDTQPMMPWPETPGTRDQFLTWSARTTIPHENLNHDGLVRVAKAHYEWLLTQSRVVKDRPLLVAAMYDPVSRTVWASTPPRGGRAATMNAKAKEGKAPTWWSKLVNLKDPSGVPSTYYHAEDNVYFNYETSTDNHAKSGKYPHGTMMAVWGRYMVSEPARERQLCRSPTEAKRIPSCMNVATQLGVGYDGALPPQTADDIVAELADADFSDYCSETSNSPTKRGVSRFQRDIISCHIPDIGPIPSTVHPTKLSFALSSSDFGISKTSVTHQLQSTTTHKPKSSSMTHHKVSTIAKPSTMHSPKATITPPPTKTAPLPKPSCSTQNEDPDQGINTRYCICDKSVTLPMITAPATGPPSVDTCDYTSLPLSETIHPTPDFGPPRTYLDRCEACTSTENNGNICTSLPNCAIPTAAVTIQAGSSPVHVGTLTGTELYTSVSNALETLCPSASQTTSMTACSTDKVEIKNIPYVQDELGEPSLLKGSLVVSVESSAYNLTSLRDAMIHSAAMSAQHAATDKNCYDAEYESSIYERRDEWSGWVPRLFGREHVQAPTKKKINLCNTVQFAGVNYYNPYWRQQPQPGASDWIDAHFGFEVDPSGVFACEVLEGAIDAFAVLTPEFTVGEVELGEVIAMACRKDFGAR